MPTPKQNVKAQKASANNEVPKKNKNKKAQKPREDEEEEQVEQKRINKKQMQEDDDDEVEKMVEEESDEDDEMEEEDEMDDIYIPKKKVKVEKDIEKAVKAPKKAAEATEEDEEEDEEEKSEKKKPAQKQPKTKADRFSKKNKDGDNSQRGILYIGHLPYGFVEDGLKEFFKQYGEILNIHLARSKKTARSMGFAFIEFKHKEVAKIAAEAMNGYMLYGKQLACRVIEDDKGLKVHTKKFKFIPFSKMFIEQKNKDKDPKQLRREVKNLLKLEERRREKLKELNINYDFPGFKSIVDETTKKMEATTV